MFKKPQKTSQDLQVVYDQKDSRRNANEIKLNVRSSETHEKYENNTFSFKSKCINKMFCKCKQFCRRLNIDD